MKMLLQSNQSPLLLALAVISLSPVGTGLLSAAQDPRAPRAEDQKIGTRIVNFFKDIVYWEEPGARYRGYGPQPQRRQPETRYSLDTPPMAEPRRSYTPSPAPQPEPRERESDREREPAPPRREVADTPSKPKPKPQKEREVSEPVTPKKPVRKEEPVATKKPEPAVEENPPVEKEKPAPVMKEESPPPPPPTVTEKTTPPPPTEPQKSFMGPSTSTPPSTPPTETPATTSPSTSTSPMVGSKTSTPGRVKSPYPPFNELDVTGLPSGSLAMDPTTQKVFRVP